LAIDAQPSGSQIKEVGEPYSRPFLAGGSTFLRVRFLGWGLRSLDLAAIMAVVAVQNPGVPAIRTVAGRPWKNFPGGR